MSWSGPESRPIPSYLLEPFTISSGVRTVIGETNPHLHSDTATGIAIGENKIQAFIDVGSKLAHPTALKNTLAIGIPFAETVLIFASHMDDDHVAGIPPMEAALEGMGVKTRTFIPKGAENDDTRAAFYGRKTAPFKPDGVIKSGQKFYLDDVEVTIYNAPGHKKNQLAFAIKDRDGIVLFAADTMGLLFPSNEVPLQYQLDQQNESIAEVSGIPAHKIIRGHDNPKEPLKKSSWNQLVNNFAKTKSDLMPGAGYIGRYGWDQQYYPA